MSRGCVTSATAAMSYFKEHIHQRVHPQAG
jgi:hypothetical protein